MTNCMIIDGEEYVSLKEAAEILKSQNIYYRNIGYKLEHLTIDNKNYIKKIDVENLVTFYKERELLRKELAKKKVLMMKQYKIERELTSNKIEEIEKKYLNINPHYKLYLIFLNNFKNIILQKENNQSIGYRSYRSWRNIKSSFDKIKVSSLSSLETLIILFPPRHLERLREKYNQDINEAVLLCNFNVKLYTRRELNAQY